MTRLFQSNNTILPNLDSAGRPIAFTWNGRKHRMRSTVQQWSIDTDWWAADGRVHRDYFALITMNQMLCVVYHDLLTGEWCISRIYD